jgi:hypothetical protein
MNPQKAASYVGPGVLRKGGKITKVPNGPLIKKKGPYAGSTLKTGGVIKKAQTGVKLTPQQKRAQLDSITAVKRTEIARKKDSILNRNAAAKGMTREEVRAQQKKDAKKPDACIPGLNVKGANKRGETKGSCTTGDSMGGGSLKDTKRNGGLIKRDDGSYSRRGLWDNIRKNRGSGKKPTKQMLQQERKIKAKSKK